MFPTSQTQALMKGELVTTFADTMRVMQFQEVRVVKVWHTLTLKVRAVYPQNVV